MIPFEVELEVSDFERVTAAVFGQTAGKVGDRVDKLVRDIEQQLGEHRVRLRPRAGCCKKMEAHIFYIWSDPYTWIDARHQILNRPPHTLISRGVFPSRCATVVQIQRLLCSSRHLCG